VRRAIDDLRRRASPATLAGSLLAAPDGLHLPYAEALAEAGAWLHVDLIDDAYPLGAGVPEHLLPALASSGAHLDIHLLVREPAHWMERVIEHRPDRITIQLETLRRPWAWRLKRLRELCRHNGTALWVGLAPSTPPDEAAGALAVADGVLVMLAEPGRPGIVADPRMVSRLTELGDLPRGVDGGVTETAFAAIRAAGGSYLVMGRRLWSLANDSATLG
jgi:pentose-5-phosphate-3-epimerase